MECFMHSMASWSKGASPAIFRVGVASLWILCAALGSASSYQCIQMGSGIFDPVIDACYWHWRTTDKTERGSYLPSSGWMTSDSFQWCPATGRGAVGKMGAQGVPYEIEKIVV